jgi:hypothetical protein
VNLSAKRGPRARKKQEQEASYASAYDVRFLRTVTTLRLATEGNSLPERLATLGQLLDLVEKVNAEETVENNNETGSIHDDTSRS